MSWKFLKKFKLHKSNKIGYLGQWVAKLARRATADLWVRIQSWNFKKSKGAIEPRTQEV
jgi:hypothetical protein